MAHCYHCFNLLRFKDGFWRSKGDTVTCPARSQGHEVAEPSLEQVRALELWAEVYGRNWKSALREAWMTGDYGRFERCDLLQQLRNTFGPSWLISFRLSLRA